MKYVFGPHQRQINELSKAIILSDILAAIGLVFLMAALIGIAAVLYRPIGV